MVLILLLVPNKPSSVQERIFLLSPYTAELEREYTLRALDKNQLTTPYGEVSDFENYLLNLSGRNHCIAVNSGTSALHLALRLLNCNSNSYVFVQDLTFCASVNPILYCGAKPVFIDSCPVSWNMDLELLERTLKLYKSQSKHICAIVPVDLYGMPNDYEGLLQISKTYGIPIIEDAAEALGSSFKSKPCGSFGKFSVLSFNGNKIVTTGGGGALLCDDSSSASKARYLANQAKDDLPYYSHSEVGYNYRLSNLSAALGNAQLKTLESKLVAKKTINQQYRDIFRKFSFIKFQESPDKHYCTNNWLTCITVDPEYIRDVNPEMIRLQLESDNIESRPLWKPMHMQPAYKEFDASLSGVSEDLFSRGLCLPSSVGLTDDEFSRITNSLSKIFK